MAATAITGNSGQVFDPWLSFAHWSDPKLTYSFPSNGSTYSYQGTNDVFALNSAQKNAVRNVLDDISSFTGLEFTEVPESSSNQGVLRYVNETGSSGAYAYGPGYGETGGDTFLGTNSADPVVGNEGYLYFLHEIAHNFGLRHGHEFPEFVASGFDSQEYTIATYTDYVGDTNPGSFATGDIDWAHSFMQLDIAALQFLYGANYSSSGEDWSGNTVYTFNPNTGEMYINGVGQGTPAGNRIFRTVWDGHGEDTYDLSNYANGMSIDLSAGGWSTFDVAQLADLNRHSTDPKYLAEGNVANARLVGDDERSLIENAKGGAGNDAIRGNQADNELTGNGGKDRLMGRGGEDTLSGNADNDNIYGAGGADDLRGGSGNDDLYGGAGGDTLTGGSNYDRLYGNDGMDQLYGQDGNDMLNGGAGRDIIHGGVGSDVLYGGADRDIFLYLSEDESFAWTPGDVIMDFEIGEDKIDLSQMITGEFSYAKAGSFLASGPSVITQVIGGDTRILADVDGDQKADFGITLDGVTGITAGDFIF